MDDKQSLPDIYFGEDFEPHDAPLPYVDLGEDDDEELPETPADVVEILGFDPLELDEPEASTD